MKTKTKPAALTWKALLLLCSPLLGATVPSLAQKYTPPPPPLTAEPCKPTKKDPCPAPASTPAPSTDAHPFPGEPPATDSHAFPGEPATSASNPGAADATGSHPFPGEPADAAAPTSSSSSSSSSDNPANGIPDPADAGKPGLKDEGSSGSTRFQRRKLPRIEDKDQREAEDLQVSRYYASTGDYRAAYLRAKDAVASIPNDPEAHFQLAQVAAKYSKQAEAQAEYRLYLQLDPDGQHVRVAQKALEEKSPK